MWRLFCGPRMQCSDWPVDRVYEDSSGFMENPGFVTKIQGDAQLGGKNDRFAYTITFLSSFRIYET